MQKEQVVEQTSRQLDILQRVETLREAMRTQAMRIERLVQRNRGLTRRADVLNSLFWDLSEKELSKEEVVWKGEMEKIKVGVARWSGVLEGAKGVKVERAVGGGGSGEVEGLEAVYEELVREKGVILKVYRRYEGISEEVGRLRI
jgi:hypothetical protein